jgi:hypothetical protein
MTVPYAREITFWNADATRSERSEQAPRARPVHVRHRARVWLSVCGLAVAGLIVVSVALVGPTDGGSARSGASRSGDVSVAGGPDAGLAVLFGETALAAGRAAARGPASDAGLTVLFGETALAAGPR